MIQSLVNPILKMHNVFLSFSVQLQFLTTRDVVIPLTGVSILLCMVNYLVPAQVAVGSELLVTKKVKLITNFKLNGVVLLIKTCFKSV